MKHRVIIPKFEAFDKNWLINNFNCPVVPLSYSELMVCAGRITHSKFNLYSLSTSDGVSGTGWQVWRQKMFNIKTHEINWITIGEFENKEQAVLFELRWA